MLSTIAHNLCANGFAARIDGDTLHVGGYVVSASLTGDVRMTAPNVGTLTVASMRDGATGVAQRILDALHYAG